MGLLTKFCSLWNLIPSAVSILKKAVKSITVNALWWDLLPVFHCPLPEHPLSWSWCSCESSCTCRPGGTQWASLAGLCTCTSCCPPSSIPVPARANSCHSKDALQGSLQTPDLLNKIWPELFSYVEDTFLLSCSFGVFFFRGGIQKALKTVIVKKTHRKTSSKGSIITVTIIDQLQNTQKVAWACKWTGKERKPGLVEATLSSLV